MCVCVCASDGGGGCDEEFNVQFRSPSTHLSPEVEGINGETCSSGVVLERSRHEPLWEEECRHPIRVGRAFCNPTADKLNARNKILQKIWERGRGVKVSILGCNGQGESLRAHYGVIHIQDN